MFKDKPKIQNKTAYFNKAVKNMDNDDYENQNKIDSHEIILERLKYENLGDPSDYEQQIYNQQFLGWIELLENTKLYEAVKSLSIEDQIFISYIIKEKRTGRELEEIYHIKHQNICKKYNKLINKIRVHLFKK